MYHTFTAIFCPAKCQKLEYKRKTNTAFPLSLFMCQCTVYTAQSNK